MLKVCPITASSRNATISMFCMGEKCAWYCKFAHECAIPLLAGMFADSEICRNVFSEETVTSGEKNENEETPVKKPICMPLSYHYGTYRCLKCGTVYDNCMLGPPTRCTTCHLDFEPMEVTL